MTKKDENLFDVVAVSMISNRVEVMATGKTERNADAIEMMAVSRRGCETHFYSTVPTGKYKDGDMWDGV